MLSLKINKILEEQGKTPYWLGKQTGISQNNILKICNGETSTIRFDTLEKICNNNAVWQFCCTSYTHLFDMYGLFFTSMQKTYLTDAAPTAFEVV